MIKSIDQLPIEGKRVFIRVDFNVPLTPARGVADDSRIRAAVPTIEYAIKQGARVILASHLGRPKGPTPGLSLEPVGARLAELLGKEVLLTDEAVGDGARKVVNDLRDGDVERPYLAVVGGAKVSDKIGVLENLLGRVDAFLIGGAMANTFVKAKGGDVGKSKVEEDKMAVARAFLAKAEQRKVEVLLPSDAVAATSLDAR